MKIMLFLALLVSCVGKPETKPTKTAHEKYMCEKNKKIAEQSGSGIIIECED